MCLSQAPAYGREHPGWELALCRPSQTCCVALGKSSPSGCQSPQLWDEGDSESLSAAAPSPAGMEAPATQGDGAFHPHPVMPPLGSEPERMRYSPASSLHLHVDSAFSLKALLVFSPLNPTAASHPSPRSSKGRRISEN